MKWILWIGWTYILVCSNNLKNFSLTPLPPLCNVASGNDLILSTLVPITWKTGEAVAAVESCKKFKLKNCGWQHKSTPNSKVYTSLDEIRKHPSAIPNGLLFPGWSVTSYYCFVKKHLQSSATTWYLQNKIWLPIV